MVIVRFPAASNNRAALVLFLPLFARVTPGTQFSQWSTVTLVLVRLERLYPMVKVKPRVWFSVKIYKNMKLPDIPSRSSADFTLVRFRPPRSNASRHHHLGTLLWLQNQVLRSPMASSSTL